jgi:homoserine kinase
MLFTFIGTYCYLYEVQRKIQDLQPFIQVKKGVAISYGLGASGCAILIMLLVVTTVIFT